MPQFIYHKKVTYTPIQYTNQIWKAGFWYLLESAVHCSNFLFCKLGGPERGRKTAWNHEHSPFPKFQNYVTFFFIENNYILLLDSVFLMILIWGQILRRNWDKNLKSFHPCYSQSSLLTDFTPPPPPSNSGFELVCKKNLKSDNSLDYCQKPQQNCTFMTSAFGQIIVSLTVQSIPWIRCNPVPKPLNLYPHICMLSHVP